MLLRQYFHGRSSITENRREHPKPTVSAVFGWLRILLNIGPCPEVARLFLFHGAGCKLGSIGATWPEPAFGTAILVGAFRSRYGAA